MDNSAQDKDQAEASNSMDVDANDANDAGRGDLAGDTQTGSGEKQTEMWWTAAHGAKTREKLVML